MSAVLPTLEYAVYDVAPTGRETRLAAFVLEADARRFARSMQRSATATTSPRSPRIARMGVQSDERLHDIAQLDELIRLAKQLGFWDDVAHWEAEEEPK
ncbi:MAG: hypothetical protein JSS74_07920 [Actinobacteria bacterium]|nr:hypothetical protein [Actinomycetota bacterium]